jgi:hypothetical protein
VSLFWAMHHVGQSGPAAAAATDASRSAREAKTRVDELEARCDRALLVCEALWTILRDKLGVTEEDLVNRVNEIDLSDGKLDGQVRRPAWRCPKCSRTIPRRFAKCMYCGQPVQNDPFAP